MWAPAGTSRAPFGGLGDFRAVPEWFPALLYGVFATHLPFFAWRWGRDGELRHAATSVTFALLVVTYALRVFAPGIEVEGVPLYAWVRVPAWISAVLSLGLLAQHGLRALRR